MTKYYQHIFCSLYELNISFLMPLQRFLKYLAQKNIKEKSKEAKKSSFFVDSFIKKKFEREYILANFSFQNSRDFFS